MTGPEMDEQLRSLASIAGSSGRLPASAQLRRRSERRQQRRVAAGALALVLLGGGATFTYLDRFSDDAAGLPAVSPSVRISNSDPAPSTSAPDPSSVGLAVPNDDRQVVVTVAGTEKKLHIDKNDRIDAAGTRTDLTTRIAFVPLDTGNRFVIQTVRVRGGEPDCVQNLATGELALKLCDQDVRAQTFELAPADHSGRTFTIEARYGPVRVDGDLVYTDQDAAPTVLTATDTGTYSSIYGDP